MPYSPDNYFRLYEDNSVDETNVYGKYDGVWYRLSIPEGTVITCDGNRPEVLVVKVKDGVPTFDPNLTFSQEVTLYKTDEQPEYNFNQIIWPDEWEEVVSFTEIVDGIAQ